MKRTLADEIIDLQIAQVRVERQLAELDRRVRRSWLTPTITTIGGVAVALVAGWFGLQQTREQGRAQALETARQEARGPSTAAVAEKAARMALEAHDRAREQQTRRLVREMLAQAPMRREPAN